MGFHHNPLTCEMLSCGYAWVMELPAKKVRVDVFDGGGNRYTVTFEGQVTREKAVRLLDIVELLGGMPTGNNDHELSEASKFDRVQRITEKHFPLVWFSSSDVQAVFENELKEGISLSTVGTYLSRLATRGILAKNGEGGRRHYRSVT